MKLIIAVFCVAFLGSASAFFDKMKQCYEQSTTCFQNAGSDLTQHAACATQLANCLKGSFGDEPLSDDESSKPECVVGFRDCMKASGRDVEKIKQCFKNKYDCFKGKVQDKAACMKKCYADNKDDKKAMAKCFVGCVKPTKEESDEENKGQTIKACKDQCREDNKDDHKARAKCFKVCVKPSKEESDEDDSTSCRDQFKQCKSADDAKVMECAKSFAKCLKEKVENKGQEIKACSAKCYADNKDDKLAAFKCALGCVKPSSDDELAFDGEQSCKDKLVVCLKDAGRDRAKLYECYKAAKQCVADKVKPKVECVKKCKEGFKPCRAGGKSIKECLKEGYQCVKAC